MMATRNLPDEIAAAHPAGLTGRTTYIGGAPIGSTYEGSLALHTPQFAPVFLTAGETVNRIGFKTSVASGAGGVVRLGLYASTLRGIGDLIEDFGTVDTTVTPGALELTVSYPVTGTGKYWVALCAQVSAPTVTLVRQSQVGQLALLDLTNAFAVTYSFNGLTSTAGATVTGALPTSYGTNVIASYAPAIAVRRTA